MTHSYDYDAVVIGSGMSGGYAAKDFCEKGLKTLVLDRGKPMEHGADYVTEGLAPWDMEFRGQAPRDEMAEQQFIQKKCYGVNDFTRHHFINDKENPYEQEKPFDWIRSSKVGGKSLLWARNCYRWSDLDFEANKKDGHGNDWPIRYKDIEKWYDTVETFVGISGSTENLPHLPDGKFLPPIPLNIVERNLKERLETHYNNERKMIPTRVAHLTEPTEEHLELGRGQCQSRNECQRGCSWGGFYSSMSGSLPAAERTGHLTLRANAMVHSLLYDEKTKKATGVRFIDVETKETHVVTARVIFVCASTVASTQILLNSKSSAFPKGLGNTSGVLGHYLSDHIDHVGAYGKIPGFKEHYYRGRRPGGIFIPRFRNLKENDASFLRGYHFGGDTRREAWHPAAGKQGIGANFKYEATQPGSWMINLYGFGEMLPKFENKISLSETQTDQWGLPIVKIDCAYGDNEMRMKQDMMEQAVAILEAMGIEDVKGRHDVSAPGIAIHEMGTARMGHDPRDSYLNKWNQSHEVNNVFVTDGAAFPSNACQNPSITFMALTARAVDYAVQQMKEGVF